LLGGTVGSGSSNTIRMTSNGTVSVELSNLNVLFETALALILKFSGLKRVLVLGEYHG